MWPFASSKHAPASEEKALGLDILSVFGVMPSAAGISVTAETALGCAPVRQAVTLISGSIASLPIRFTRTSGGGRKRELTPEDYRPAAIVRRPNPWTRATVLWRDLIADLVLSGNGFAVIIRVRGEPREIHRVQPESVSVERDLQTLEPRYRVTLQNNECRVYSFNDIIHLRGLPAADGLRGRGLIHDAKEAIGLSILLERHAARLFANGARPSGIIKVPTTLNAGAAARLKASWQSLHAGENAGGTAVMENGASWESLTMSSVDSEFAALRRFSVADIARAANLSPLLLGDLEKSTFSNAEIAAQNLLSFTLTPIIEHIEDEIERVLIPLADRDSVSADFDYASFATADLEKRTAAASRRIEAGLSTVNEERAALGRSPVAGGDEPRTSVQSTPLTAAPAIAHSKTIRLTKSAGGDSTYHVLTTESAAE